MWEIDGGKKGMKNKKAKEEESELRTMEIKVVIQSKIDTW